MRAKKNGESFGVRRWRTELAKLEGNIMLGRASVPVSKPAVPRILRRQMGAVMFAWHTPSNGAKFPQDWIEYVPEEWVDVKVTKKHQRWWKRWCRAWALIGEQVRTCFAPVYTGPHIPWAGELAPVVPVRECGPGGESPQTP